MLCSVSLLRAMVVSSIACALALTPLVVNAASSSTNYSLTRNVVASGGGSSVSINYDIQSVVGQSSVVGKSISTNYIVAAGFITIADTDGDGVLDNVDNCINDVNPTQLDTDSDGLGNIECDLDDDNDGLSDSVEDTFGSNSLLIDTDFDGLNDFDEYNSGISPTDPTNPDTDGDGLLDGVDPDPLVPELTPDGDLAPYGNPDGIINAADLLIAQRIVQGILAQPTGANLIHGDVYPPGTGDGVIDISDLILIQQLVLQ